MNTAEHAAPVTTTVRADRTIVFAAWALTALLVVMLARVLQLQVAPSHQLMEQRQSRISTRVELPVRGDLLDRRGRLVNATRFGWRIYVDPVSLKPDSIDVAIVEIARALGRPPEEVGERVMWAMEENQRRAAVAAGVNPPAPARPAPDQWLRELVGLETPHKEVQETELLANADATPEIEVDQVSGLEISPISFADVPAPAVVLKPIRYLPFRDLVEDAVAASLRQKRVAGVALERIPVREEVAGDPVAALVGKVGVERNIGMEAKLEDRLAGKAGRVSYYRDARMRPLWIEPGQIQLPVHGEDVRLSIDLELQSMGLEELQRGIEEADAAGGRLVAIDPRTGEILAMCDIVRNLPNLKEYPWEDDPRALREQGKQPSRLPYMAPRPGASRYRTIPIDKARADHPDVPALLRNRCAEDVYEPGSTFKPFVWATITELGLAGVEEVIDTESGRWVTPYGRKLNDVTKRDVMTWSQVLVNSSNIGMAKVVERLTHRQLCDAVHRFGFGKPTGVGIAGEASGIVTSLKDWTIYSQTSYAIGHEVAVTPLQMVRGFSAFARSGDLAGTLADLRLTAANPAEPSSNVLYRVLPSRVAELTRHTMQGVAENMQNRLQQSDHSQTGWKYTIFGKSGTAEIPLGKAPPGKRAPAGSTGYYDDQYNSSFIAGGPIEQPCLVTLVVIDDPGPELVFARPLPRHYGAATAGPVVRRFMERALTYLGAPPSVRPETAPSESHDMAAAGLPD